MSRLMSERLDIAPGCTALLAANRLGTLEDVFHHADGERLDKAGLESWRQRWRLRLEDGSGACVVYLKRFAHPPLRRQIDRWRAGAPWRSTAGIEWDNARDLAAAGIAAAEAVGMGERMQGPLERCSFILLREVPGESLERWVPAHGPALAGDPCRRRSLIDELARFVGRFHRAGYVHRDLYLCHIFIRATADDTRTAEFRLIDLQRVFRPRWRRLRWYIKDLAALDSSAPDPIVSERDRLRFLCRYARASGYAGSLRALAARVRGKAARMRTRVAKNTVGKI